MSRVCGERAKRLRSGRRAAKARWSPEDAASSLPRGTRKMPASAIGPRPFSGRIPGARPSAERVFPLPPGPARRDRQRVGHTGRALRKTNSRDAHAGALTAA